MASHTAPTTQDPYSEWVGRTQERGLTLVPTRVYFSDQGARAKVEIALGRGKDIHDKRETIRRRESAREIQRELREAQR